MPCCIFCDEIAGESPNVFHRSKSGAWVARWDGFPLSPGHAEIVPTYHAERIEDMSVLQLAEIFVFAREVMSVIESTDLTEVYWHMSGLPLNETAAGLIEKVLGQLPISRPPDAYTFGLNDGKEAGQTVPHVHLHIVPRWRGDVQNPRGGIRNIFPGDPYAAL